MDAFLVLGYVHSIENGLTPIIVPIPMINLILSYSLTKAVDRYILPNNDILYTQDLKTIHEFMLNKLLTNYGSLTTMNSESKEVFKYGLKVAMNIIEIRFKSLDDDYNIYQRSLFDPSYQFIQSFITKVMIMSDKNRKRYKLVIDSLTEFKQSLTTIQAETTLSNYGVPANANNIHRMVDLLRNCNLDSNRNRWWQSFQ